MNRFCCPICGKVLRRSSKDYLVCPEGHGKLHYCPTGDQAPTQESHPPGPPRQHGAESSS